MAFKAPQPFRPEWGREVGARQRPFEIAFHHFEHAKQIVLADTMADAQVHSLRKGTLARFGAPELSFFAIAI
jgi:hypothetical protein